MSQKQFTSSYTNDSKYVKEYIQATLKPYTKIMLLCAVIAFAFAGATIALRIQTTISILFLYSEVVYYWMPIIFLGIVRIKRQ